jgi:hypothetical protein
MVQRGVSPASLIEALDVEEQIGFRLIASAVHTMVHQLAFECGEEALRGCIVVPCSHPIHTDLKAVLLAGLDTCHPCTDCPDRSGESGPPQVDADRWPSSEQPT